MLFSRESDQLQNSSHKACFQVSNSAGLQKGMLFLISWFVNISLLWFSLRKLKPSKIGLKFKMHAQICH